jgi:hypothetical protein
MKAIAALMAFKNIGDFHQEMESLWLSQHSSGTMTQILTITSVRLFSFLQIEGRTMGSSI